MCTSDLMYKNAFKSFLNLNDVQNPTDATNINIVLADFKILHRQNFNRFQNTNHKPLIFFYGLVQFLSHPFI